MMYEGFFIKAFSIQYLKNIIYYKIYFKIQLHYKDSLIKGKKYSSQSGKKCIIKLHIKLSAWLIFCIGNFYSIP